MRIRIVTQMTGLANILAEEIRQQTSAEVCVVKGVCSQMKVVASNKLKDSEVKDILTVLDPIIPEKVEYNKVIKQTDLEIYLGDSLPLSHYMLELNANTPSLLDLMEVNLAEQLGMRIFSREKRMTDTNVIRYGNATPFCRQVIRWKLKQSGYNIREEKASLELLENIEVYLEDPDESTKPIKQRMVINIRVDDKKLSKEFKFLLRQNSFICNEISMLDQYERDNSAIELRSGWFTTGKGAKEMYELHQLLEQFIIEKGVDTNRYPVELTEGINGDQRVDICLPIKFCQEQKKIPYGRKYPQKCKIRINTDSDDIFSKIRSALYDFDFVNIDKVEEDWGSIHELKDKIEIEFDRDKVLPTIKLMITEAFFSTLTALGEDPSKCKLYDFGAFDCDIVITIPSQVYRKRYQMGLIKNDEDEKLEPFSFDGLDLDLNEERSEAAQSGEKAKVIDLFIPFKTEQIFRSIEQLLEDDNIEKAAAEHLRLKTLTENNINLRLRLAHLFNKYSCTDEALEHYLWVAHKFREDGFFLKSIAIFKQAQRLEPENPKHYLSLAEINLEQGLDNNARYELNCGLELCLLNDDEAMTELLEQKLEALTTDNQADNN